MRKRKPLEGDINNVAKAMKESKNSAHFRRIQCVYLAMLHPNMTAEEIAATTLFTARNVGYILADYRASGLVAMEDARGGRHRENLTLAQETELLAPFEKESQNGSIITISKVKKAYEEKVGREVAESTIYRILNKHGFRRLVPYRRHKKADKAEQEDFKKTLQP
jgi:transposase